MLVSWLVTQMSQLKLKYQTSLPGDQFSPSWLGHFKALALA